MTKKLFRVFLLLCLLIGAALATLLMQGYFRYQREIEEKPLITAVEEYTKKDGYTEFDEIDEDFVNAVIAVEDKRFFTRKGYDFIALARALYHNLKAGSLIEGGSTITEQIAKNLYLDGKVVGLEDKMAEIFIMFGLERSCSKKDLFALYASMNYYGDGYWGIKEAAEGYYDKRSDDLTIAEAAMLAGIPNAPAIYQLSDGYELAKERQEWVLQTMQRNGFITESEMAAAQLEDVRPVSKEKP